MIKLEPFKKNDFARLISWVDSEEAMVQFAGGVFTFPLTEEQLEEYIKTPKRYVFKVVSPLYNLTIGHAEIQITGDSIPKLCRVLIGEKNFRGKKLGQEIINELLRYAFTKLNATKAELYVYDWNIPAIKCYEKVGFTLNPDIKKPREVNGKIWTALNMVITKSAWKSKYAPGV